MNPSQYFNAPKGRSMSVTAVFALMLVLLVTVFRGSNRYVPLVLIEWLGLALMLVLCAEVLSRYNALALGTKDWARWAAGLLIASPLWIATVQMVLLPMPAHTEIWSSALAGLPAVAMLFFALASDDRTLQTVRRTWVGIAALQAMIGIAQMGGTDVLRFSKAVDIAAIGTFANRNHFANFLAMCIPLVILELKPTERRNLKTRRMWLWLCLLFALIAAILASQSRAGLVTAVIAGTLSSLVVFSSEGRQSRIARIAAWLVPAFVLLAVIAGGLDWLSRFEWDALSSSALERAENRDATWRGALANLPWGSGLGTFNNAFASWQPGGYAYWLDYAHSDFLQLFFETGVIAWILATLMLGLAARRLMSVGRELQLSSAGPSSETLLSLVALCGVLALLLHTWVDFPTHIPANAMLGAFLLGTFLREPTERHPAGYKK